MELGLTDPAAQPETTFGADPTFNRPQAAAGKFGFVFEFFHVDTNRHTEIAYHLGYVLPMQTRDPGLRYVPPKYVPDGDFVLLRYVIDKNGKAKK